MLSRPTRRSALQSLGVLTAAVLAPGALLPRSARAEASSTRPSTASSPWLGLHVIASNDRALELLEAQLPALADMGLNALIVEADYSFEFRSHPALAGENFVTRKGAGTLVERCRKLGVRLIPQMNCLGHQSWSKHTAALLTQYPQFDETPGKYPDNEGIYCRSWCPLHPDVNAVVFALMDDLIEGFEADAFHVGMDEIFIIGSEFCPRCRGRNPADLLARAAKDYHEHLVGRRKVEMLMWGDRLLDAKVTGYGEWEASENGTYPAIDMIPTDIIICDWHYEKRDDYPSIPLFIEKGFRVWPCGWDKVSATDALIDCELKQRDHAGRKEGKMLGHLCSVWGKVGIDRLSAWEPITESMKRWRNA